MCTYPLLLCPINLADERSVSDGAVRQCVTAAVPKTYAGCWQVLYYGVFGHGFFDLAELFLRNAAAASVLEIYHSVGNFRDIRKICYGGRSGYFKSAVQKLYKL